MTPQNLTDTEIVKQAKERVESEINTWKFLLNNYSDDMKDPMRERHLNAWLAHKAFFERHEIVRIQGVDACSNSNCWNAYPCPELVAQAKAIMGG